MHLPGHNPRAMQAPPRRTATAELATIFVVALLLRLGAVLALPVSPAWDGTIYERAAADIAAGRGYTLHAISPAAPARPTAFYPVGWPAALAATRALGGNRATDLLLQALLGALLAPLTVLLARRLAGSRAGRAAGWACALWPGGVLWSVSWLGEPLFAVLVSVGLVLVTRARRRHRVAALLGAALVLGAAAWVRPTAILVAPLLGLGLGWAWAPRRHTQARRATVGLAAAAVATLVSLAALAPWTTRNALEIGAPVLVSTNGGANLLLGTVGDGRFEHIPRAIDCPEGTPERERDRCRRSHAIARIGAAPVVWLARGALKLVHTFGYETSPAAQLDAALAGRARRARPVIVPLAYALVAGFYAALLLAAAWSAREVLRRPLARAALLAPIGAVALLHFVYLGGDRYHAPLVPLLCVLAAPTLTRLAARLRDEAATRTQRAGRRSARRP